MGWESRPGGRYYYRSQRVAGRVTRQYFGRGPAATLAESLDVEARRRREDERAALGADRAALEPLDRAMAALDAACRRMIEATLLAAGYHQHRRSWRKRRARPHDRRD